MPSVSALKGKPRGKGYTIESAITPDRSKIEVALKEAGFTCYMPVEYVAVRDRGKAGLYSLRRFALLKGYAFVADIEDADWPKLTKVVGVREIVANEGEPYQISTVDLFRLRMFEQNSKFEAMKQAEAMSRGAQRKARDQRKTAIRGARKKLFPGRSVKLIWGEKVGREATVQAWHDEDQVKAILHELDGSTETISVPYEYLKAS